MGNAWSLTTQPPAKGLRAGTPPLLANVLGGTLGFTGRTGFVESLFGIGNNEVITDSEIGDDLANCFPRKSQRGHHPSHIARLVGNQGRRHSFSIVADRPLKGRSR